MILRKWNLNDTGLVTGTDHMQEFLEIQDFSWLFSVRPYSSQESLYWAEFIFVKPVNTGCTHSYKYVFLFTSQLGRGKNRADSCCLSPRRTCYSMYSLSASHREFPQVGAGPGARALQLGMQAVWFPMQLSSGVRTFLTSSSGTLAAF